MKVSIDGRFSKALKKRVAGTQFEVGIIDDGPHKRVNRGGKLKSMAGGPASAISRKMSGKNISDISTYMRKQSGINFYTKPFQIKQNSEILKFSNEFIKSLSKERLSQADRNRIVNLVQAIVRNPILRGDYGMNSAQTSRRKGFNRRFVDTGQVFNAIKARMISK